APGQPRRPVRNRAISNARVKRELGYTLRYPTYLEGEAAVEAEQSGAPLPPTKEMKAEPPPGAPKEEPKPPPVQPPKDDPWTVLSGALDEIAAQLPDSSAVHRARAALMELKK